MPIFSLRQFSRLNVIASGILLLGAGCISFSGGGKNDGGLFFSADRGEKWEQRGAIATGGGQQRSLANTNVRFIVQDPVDPKALYIGTDGEGAYYSWDGGTLWASLGGPFAQARVEAVAVHPTDTCSFWVAAGQKVFRSEDCARNWTSSDFEVAVSALTVDPASPSVLYAGNTRGDILKSMDSGRSWSAIHRLENRIERILSARSGAGSVLYVATKNSGIYRSSDGGATWVDLRPGLQEYPAAFEYKELILAPASPGMLLYASKYGILRSVDGGASWQPLTLITAPGQVDISSLAVNARNSNEMYYGTTSTFYQSSDGGRNWISKKLPTSRAASALSVDLRDGKAIWLGTRKLDK